jgi:hypothetical protein
VLNAPPSDSESESDSDSDSESNSVPDSDKSMGASLPRLAPLPPVNPSPVTQAVIPSVTAPVVCATDEMEKDAVFYGDTK